MKRLFVLALLLTLGAASIAVSGQQNAQAPPLAIEKVKDNLYMITGAGGNTAVFVMQNGVALVDTKNPNNGQAVLDRVKSVTNKPVTTIINTHAHGDHTGSNEFFPATVDFVAHQNTKVNMEKMPAFQGDKNRFLPKRTYTDKLTLGRGADQIDLYHFGPAHTNGDTFVIFPTARVMHAGDVYPGKIVPLIDTMNGGNAAEYPKTLEKAYAALGNVDTIITGHDKTMKPADLKEYVDFNNEFLTWVQGQIRAGKTVEQSAAEYKLPAKYASYQVFTFFGGIRGNIQAAYTALNRR